MCNVLFAKQIKRICKIWPPQPLKHFTAVYRGLPPCTQSQHPINRETGYSKVLGQGSWIYASVIPASQIQTGRVFEKILRSDEKCFWQGRPTGRVFDKIFPDQ